MNDIAVKTDTKSIIIDEVFTQTADAIWRALTSGDMMARWLMPATGFEAVEGTHFTFQTTAAGAWDGTIHCQVLEVVPNKRLSYSWKGGHESNAGYGSRLDTVVTFLLSPADAGTRLRVVHSGFVLPKNEYAYQNMSDGWKVVVRRIGDSVVQ